MQEKKKEKRNIIIFQNQSLIVATMNSVGEFREREINEKTFLIFNFLSQADKPSSSSGGDDLLLQPNLFICPSIRLKAERLKIEANDCSNGVWDVSPHFASIRSVDQQSKYLFDSISSSNCKLPVSPLFWCNNRETGNDVEFYCGACLLPEIGTDYYFCVTCREMFHKECVESPLEIKHPFYPFQLLQLFTPLYIDRDCITCEKPLYDMVYHCPSNTFRMHPLCAMKSILFVIDHPKSHPHPLTFFPKQAFLPCNVCGLIKEHIPTYICVRCVFVVHQDCIYFPHVIRISRHHHRISFSCSLPTGKWLCGVCRQLVYNHYGAYSCNKCDDYFVHSRCALRKDLWDGEELEGVPEEPEIVVEPFLKIAEGIILHFSHGHRLKLEMSKVYDENKLCQACVLPIYEGSYFSCMDKCDFILHEACANAPLKKHNPLHPHALTLKVVTNEYHDDKGFFTCTACWRPSCGFVYEDPSEKWGFRLDLRCASVSEPFEYQGHKHPLFLALNPEEQLSAICQICQEVGDRKIRTSKLSCIECNFIICFSCATLPYKARYKHDKHFLTFQEKKEASDQSDWCDICERKLVYSRKGGFYSCDDYCCTTLHVDCLLGNDPYMKHGQTIKYNNVELDIIRNCTMSRPFCHAHEDRRCQAKVVFKYKNMTLCSITCVFNYTAVLNNQLYYIKS